MVNNWIDPLAPQQRFAFYCPEFTGNVSF